MPSYISTVNKQTYQVETTEEKQRIVLDSSTHAIDWQKIADLAADSKGSSGTGGRYSLIVENVSYEVFARNISKPDEKQSQTYEILVGGQRFEVKVEDKRARLLAGLVKSGTATGEAIVNAPMPGLVIGLPFEAGATVTQGQTVAVLEAMKMENDLAAPIDGVIKEIRVTKGQTVDNGEALVVIAAQE